MKTKIILLVGASGVGKDSLLNAAQKNFEKKINCVKRHITRIADENEDNYFLSDKEFDSLKKKDFFISSWSAHGNAYGIAKESIKEGMNIVSISRSRIKDFEFSYKEVYCINIYISEKELEKRLRLRNRENEEEIQKRLNKKDLSIQAKHLISFDNSQTFVKSSQTFIKLIESIIKD